MHRTTIMLPMTLKLKAEQHARAHGVSLGEVMRQALEQALKSRRQGAPRDSLFSDTAVHRGPGPSDLAANHDHYLYDEDA